MNSFFLTLWREENYGNRNTREDTQSSLDLFFIMAIFLLVVAMIALLYMQLELMVQGMLLILKSYGKLVSQFLEILLL